MNSGTTNYLDAIHELVRDSIGSISLQRLIEGVNAITPANSPNDARATARATVRDSRLIVSAGADRYEWLPRALRGVTVRHRLTSEEIESQRLRWAADLLVCLWPAHLEDGAFRNITPVRWCSEDGQSFAMNLVQEDGEAFGQSDLSFWRWLSESGLQATDDLVVTATEPTQGAFTVRPETHSERNATTIEFRDRIAKASIESFLKTQRDGLADPVRIAADILASSTYQIKVPPSPLHELLPASIKEAYARKKAPSRPPAPEPVAAPEPDAVLELAVASEPVAVLETVTEPEPAVALESVAVLEAVAPPEPAIESESVAVLETVADPEPAASTEPVAVLETVTEPEPAIEPEQVAVLEAVAEPEPAVVPEPAAVLEAVTVPERVIATEPIAVLETVAEPELAVAPEPVAVLEAVAVPEPAVAPEPAAVLEAVAAPEPAAVVETVSAPEPVAVLEAITEPEPAVVPEPVAVPETVTKPEPAVAPEPAAVPKPTAIAEPVPKPAPIALVKKVAERKVVSAQPPYNRGWELPDEAAFTRCMAEVDERGVRDLEAALALLKTSPLCAPAYAILSQSDHYQDRSLELAGQAVIATERRIAHSLIESLINGQEVVLEDLVEMYLESRGFLARTMWSARQQDEGIEQALHCYEVAPHNAEVREDLFIMLFDTARWDFILRLLDTNLGLPPSEEVYHRALVMSLIDPTSKEASKAIRKAVSTNPFLARLLLGENPTIESKKSQIAEAESYEASYGYLWRREQDVFDLLESIAVGLERETS